MNSKGTSVKVDRARATAFKILSDVYINKAYSNTALSRGLDSTENLTGVDRAFITELVYSTLRHSLSLDCIIKQFSSLKGNKISGQAMIILRMGLAQVFFMDKVPQSAACNESVKLAGKYGHEGVKRFVNGILRNVLRKTEGDIGRIEFSSWFEEYGYQKWMADEFVRDYGVETAKRIMSADSLPQPFSIRVNRLRTGREELKSSLEDSGFEVSNSEFSEDALILNKPSSITLIKQFQDGLFYVQGESSMQAVRLLGAKPGNKVLDLCSAPGGKTTHIAEIMENQGEIVAGDIYTNKLERIKENSKRLGIKIIKPVLHDATVYNEEFCEGFDCVLADVPCSGTGVIRSRPEIKFIRTEEEVSELLKIQENILKNAVRYIKPGGVLVYSTCSILKRENICQVSKLLENTDDICLGDAGMCEMYPQDGRDGFFMAQMIKVREEIND